MKKIILTFSILVAFASQGLACDVFGSIFGAALRPTDTGYRGIYRASIMLTAPGFETRSALTNAFGYYSFTQVPACNTYTVTITSKGYTFTDPLQTAILPDTDNNIEVDFVAE